MGQTLPRVEQRPCDNQRILWFKTVMLSYRLDVETQKLHRPVHSTCRQRARVFLPKPTFSSEQRSWEQ